MEEYIKRGREERKRYMKGIKRDWPNILKQEFEKDYYKNLMEFLEDEYRKETIYPHMDDIYNAFNFTAYEDVKAVILGQDPYHGPNQAHGLSFSVKPGVKTPPSLVNIYKELSTDLGCFIPNNGYLKKWADGGVLLLNTVLTVRAGQAFSHRKKGWETFTDRVIRRLNERQEPIVFLLWGRPAAAKEKLITNSRHKILKASHPSPLSARRGFFGCRHFSKTNDFLVSIDKEPIDWQIENIKS